MQNPSKQVYPLGFKTGVFSLDTWRVPVYHRRFEEDGYLDVHTHLIPPFLTAQVLER